MNGPAVKQVIVGYDGSPQASAAVHVGALLLPHAHAWITNLWTPPFADEKLRRRLWSGGRRLDEFIQVVEREGEWRASCIADIGVTLARAAGWHAEALLRRVEGGEGFQLAQLAEDMAPSYSCRTGSCSSSASTTTPPSTGQPACHQCPAAGHSSRYGSRQATAHPHRPSPTASSPARATTKQRYWLSDPEADPPCRRSCSAAWPWPPCTMPTGRSSSYLASTGDELASVSHSLIVTTIGVR